MFKANSKANRDCGKILYTDIITYFQQIADFFDDVTVCVERFFSLLRYKLAEPCYV